ncbi:MAG: hypothetical protein ACT4NT_04460 [Nitrososphaerota archaeon]
MTKTNLQLLFGFVTNKKRDAGKIIQSLKIKGILDEMNLPNKNMLKENMMDIKVDKEILDNINSLEEFAKLGKPAKSILYVLAQIKKSSLRFLADLMDESARNTYAVLQRLEEKNLVYSYNSKIYHLNVRGRRFSPRYYVITDLGKIVAKIKADVTIDQKKIDALLQKTNGEIESMHRVFSAAKKACVVFFAYVVNLVMEVESFVF